jgi:HK97 family phage major capsid protein
VNIQELRDGLDYVESCLRDIHTRAAGVALEGDDQAAWAAGVEYVESTRAAISDFEAREAIIARSAKQSHQPELRAGISTAPNFNRPAAGPEDLASDRSATAAQLADGLLRAIGERDVDDTQVRSLVKRHRNATDWTRNLLARSSDVYASAWAKYVTGREMTMTAEERAAMSVGTNANGGFLVPTHLDPTVILTNAGSSNAIRQISRVVTLVNGNTWNGITSAGVTASWDAELAEVSDDSPTFGDPSIPVYKAAAFVQASIEAFEDIDGLASDVLMMFADARDRLEGAAHATGSGSQPTGIFTALDANTNVEIVSTTAATIGLVDLQKVKRETPQRFRPRGTWVMNPVYGDAVKALGTALSASYSTDLTQSNTDLLLGRPVVETDDAPSTQTTTVRDNEIVFGDFQNYVIVDKPGSTSIEFIPHLFNTSNNLPDGRRGWYMHFRSGADSVNDVAFRLLQDKTSA